MQQQPPRQREAAGADAAIFGFEAKVENEEQLLDAMLASLIRGTLASDVWERLHAAAQRDDRLSELAFAFDSVSQGKRFKTASPGVAAEFLLRAARFLGEVIGDELGAVTYLERALAAAPTHAGSFAALERLLIGSGQVKKLAEVYATTAQHRPRGEQGSMLRRAAELLAQSGAAEDKVIELLQQVLRLEPGDEDARSRLEALYVKANRFRDVVRLNEHALAAEPLPDEWTRRGLLARLLELYADKLHEPERAMSHVEQLLALDPTHEGARRLAQKLLVIKGLAGRAAAALATAFEVSGTPQDIARYLTIELENTRGARRTALLTRLGKLKQERMGDERGAFEAFEQALAVDPIDDDLRARYVALAARLQRYVDAAKTLARVLATVKDAAARAKTSAQMGEMLLRGGDVKRAKATLAGVLALQDAPSEAILAAAYDLREILERERDPRSLCDVLERIARLESDGERRREVDERLSELAMKLRDVPRAAAAYERLLSTSARPKALEALSALYTASRDPVKHAWLLEEQAKDAGDPAKARELWMLAAQLRARETKDGAAAIATCHAVIERFGPARDVLALIIPQLEGQRLWADLATALAQEAGLTSGSERAESLGRLGTVRLQRLRDVPGAIEAFAEALATEPRERTSRSTLEKLASTGDHRLAAARVLEPLYRAEKTGGMLLKALELRGSLAGDVGERLGALREAADLAASGGTAEAAHAVDIVGRGLAEATASGRPLREWLERLERVAGPGTDPKRRAAILHMAIADREVTSEELAVLARRAAEAHVASDDVPMAITLYRRALAFDPQSTELLSRIDDLLRDRGSPAERIALYRAALTGGGTERRKELLHRIGTVERHDLRDVGAAIATYRAVLDEDSDDADAYAALEELYAQTEWWGELCALFERRVARIEGDAARSVRAKLVEVSAAHGDVQRARAHYARLLEDPQLAPEHLDAMERAAAHLDDADLACALLHRRAEMAQDPREQIGWLDRLGEVEESRRGDLEAAAAAWKRAGELAEAAGDDEAARRLFWRARKVAPEDRRVTERLVALCERAESWGELPRLYMALDDQSADDAERVELSLRTAQVLSERLRDVRSAARHAARAFELAPSRADVLANFERLSVAAEEVEPFEVAVHDALARLQAGGGTLDTTQRALLLLARARVLASDSTRADDAALAYRTLLDDVGVDREYRTDALAAFEALLSRDSGSAKRLADRRWLLEWRAEHAPEEERIARLLEWAGQEETTFADTVHALALYRRALELDAECDDALSSVARLALATGDTEQALAALRSRRDRAEGPARIAIELEIAEVLLSRTTRWKDALSSLGAVLADVPNDAAARTLAAQLLAHRATRAEAIAMLEHACDSTDDAQARAQILTRLLDAPADADDAQARRGWFERLCDLQREHANLDGALAIAVRAAREMPEVDALWDRAENLARDLVRADDVAALYEEVLARPLSREQALAIGERAVRFYEEWFEDPARVVRILERVLELDPTADWAFDRLKLVLDAAERWDDLFALYDRALASAAGKTRSMLLEDAAQTAKDFADRPDRAIGYLEQLHDLRPLDVKLASALERLYERQGQHRELVTLLSERLPRIEADEARRTRARIAALWLDELGDPAAALEMVEPLLARVADEENGVAPDLWALLERILAATPPARRSTAPPSTEGVRRSKRPPRSEPPEGARGSIRLRAAAWLRDQYVAMGREADLARMLTVELEGVRSSKERVRRHLKLAELYEKLGDLPTALEQTGFAVILAPGEDTLRAKLLELAERSGRLERLADLLAAAADSLGARTSGTEPAATDQPLRTVLMMQAAWVRADRLGDASGAIALLSAVLSSPDVPEADLLQAARKLEPLLEAAGRAEERLDVAERIADIERDDRERRAAIGRAAMLASQLGQHARGIALWERRLAVDERDVEALDGLVDLLEQEGDRERLVRVLALRAHATTSDERRRADRVRVAKLLGEALERVPEAISSWREIERDFGEADDAAVALAGLLSATKQWGELAELLERRAARATDSTVRAELLRQLGDLRREQLGAPQASVETYARSLAVDPRNAGARAGLHVLAVDGVHGGAAVEVLLIALRSCDDWHAILELTAHRLTTARSDQAKRAILLEAAEISEARANDVGLAFEAMRRAFLIAPGDEQVEGETLRLAEAGGAWPGLVDACREAIEGAARDDEALVAKLWRRIGATLETRLEDPRGALVAYMRVASAAEEGPASLDAVRVASKLAEWEVAARVVVDLARRKGAAPTEALELLEQAASASDAWGRVTSALADATAASDLVGVAARDLYARLAKWHRDRLSDPDGAEVALRRALEQDGSNASLLAELAQLQRRNPGRPLVDTLTRLSEATGGDLGLLREAAEAARDSAHDPALALSLVNGVLELARNRWVRDGEGSPSASGNPDAPAFAGWAIESLVQLHEAGRDPRAALEVLVAGAALGFEPGVRSNMRRRAARVAADELGDHERAIALYLALFDDDPRDSEAVERLEAIYTALGRTRDLLEMRRRQVLAASDIEQRLALRLQTARLLVALGDSAGAVEVLRANLGEDVRHEATVDALAAVLEAEVRTGDLRNLLAEQAQLAEESGASDRAAELWLRAATLAEERLGDVEAAAMYHARVVALAPAAASFDALARLAQERSDHSAAAEWLERLLEITEPAKRLGAILRLADAFVAAGQPALAAQRLEALLAAAPEENAVRARLATLYGEQRDWAKLAQLVADAAAHAPDKATRMSRLLEAANLFAERCGDPERAIPFLEQASDLAPHDQPVRLGLAGVLVRARRFDEARTILQSMIEAFGGRRPRERAPVHYQMARLELEMGNRARALVELDTATRVDPQNPEILRTFAELARDDGQLERAEKSYRALLVVLRRSGDGGGAAGFSRSEVLLELSAIAQRHGEVERASEILESALESATQSELEEDRLESALRARSDYVTLVRVLESRLAREDDSPAATRTLGELADVLADRLGRPDQALAMRLRAMANDPRSIPAHDAALGLAQAVGAVERYIDSASGLVNKAIEEGDVPLACSLLIRLGGVAENNLEDDRRAAALYERAVDLGQRSPGILRALDQVYERLGETEKQAQILAMRVEAEAVEGGAASDAIYRLAGLRLSSAKTLDEGVEMLRTAVDLDPQLDRAEEALRRALGIDPSHRRIIDLYEQIGRQPGHERALVDALHLRAQLPGGDAEAVREAVEIALRIGDAVLAESLLEQFVNAESSAQSVATLAWAFAALASLRESAGDLRKAVELKERAARIADPEVARRLEFEVARIAAERLGDLALAAKTYEGLHRADPADRETWEALAEVYRRIGDAQKLTDLLATVVDYVEDVSERTRLRLERVRTMVHGLHLGDEEAAPLLREIVEEDASQVEAGLMLAAILERTGARAELAELLARQMDAARDRGDPASVASFAQRLGTLLEQTDQMQARSVYYAGLDWEPKSRDLLDSLLRLLGSEEDESERADVLERRLVLEHGPDAESMALALSAARINLSDEPAAQRALELGYVAHPASVTLRERLERMYQERKDWSKLAELYVVDAAARTDPGERVSRLRQAAELWRAQLGDPRAAAEALRLAREVSPDDPSLLRDYVDILVEAGNRAGAIAELSRALDGRDAADPRRAAILGRRAAIRASANDDSSAYDDLEAAFALDPEAHAVSFAVQIERLREAATSVGDVTRARALRLRRAQVLPFARDADGARTILVELLKHDAKDRDALRALATLEASLDRWDAASAALRRLVGLEEGAAAIETALHLADACERADRSGDARGALERARILAPADREVRERLERVYEHTGAWHELSDLALEDARASRDVAERFALLLRAGSLLLERAGESETAIVTLQEALALRPTDVNCIGLLADAYTLSGQPAGATALLERAMGPHKGRRTRELAPLYWRLARVARCADDTVGEARALVQAIECDSQNGQVCADVALRAMEIGQLELANRALRAVTLLKTPGPLSKALGYQYMGEIARKQGDAKRALTLLRRALVEDPTLEGARALVDTMERGL
jgi:tetratricopeptide (TPR) repeat protein